MDNSRDALAIELGEARDIIDTLKAERDQLRAEVESLRQEMRDMNREHQQEMRDAEMQREMHERY